MRCGTIMCLCVVGIYLKWNYCVQPTYLQCSWFGICPVWNSQEDREIMIIQGTEWFNQHISIQLCPSIPHTRTMAKGIENSQELRKLYLFSNALKVCIVGSYIYIVFNTGWMLFDQSAPKVEYRIQWTSQGLSFLARRASYLLQQFPILDPSGGPCVSRVPPSFAPAPSPSLGSFLAMAKNMSFTLRAVFALVSMKSSPFSSA